MAVVGSLNGLRRIILPQRSLNQIQQLLQPYFHACIENTNVFGDLPRRLQDYFMGNMTDFPDELDWGGVTPFQHAVWTTARGIPHGEARSYSWLAKQINRKKAARAVGQAMRRNPWPIIVPCHRVLASNGGLGGFAGGLEMKRRLLEIERQALSRS